jgi:hypothetical protein
MSDVVDGFEVRAVDMDTSLSNSAFLPDLAFVNGRKRKGMHKYDQGRLTVSWHWRGHHDRCQALQKLHHCQGLPGLGTIPAYCFLHYLVGCDALGLDLPSQRDLLQPHCLPVQAARLANVGGDLKSSSQEKARSHDLNKQSEVYLASLFLYTRSNLQ